MIQLYYCCVQFFLASPSSSFERAPAVGTGRVFITIFFLIRVLTNFVTVKINTTAGIKKKKTLSYSTNVTVHRCITTSSKCILPRLVVNCVISNYCLFYITRIIYYYVKPKSEGMKIMVF